jgi:hypothetical protein
VKYHEINSIDQVQRKTSSFLYKEGELRDAQNFDLHTKIGSAIKAGDYTRIGNQISASKNILGLGTFVRGGSSAGTYELYTLCSGASTATIYKYNTGTSQWDAQTGSGASLTNTAEGEFISCAELDILFFANYSDVTRSYNGSSWSTSTHVTSAPQAKYGAMHLDRLFLGHCYITDTAYPCRYYFSSDATDGSLTWDTTNDWFLLPEPIMGFEKNGENLLCFTRNYIYRVDDVEKHEIAKIGTTSRRSIATNGSWTFFANDDGVWATDLRGIQKVSRAGDEYFKGITASYLDNLTGDFYNDVYYLYIDDITSPLTRGQMVWAYDLSQSKSEIYSLADTPLILKTVTESSSNKSLYFGNNNGEVMEMFSGTGQDGAVFDALIEFPRIRITGSINSYRTVDVFGDNLAGTVVQYRTSEDKPWSNANGELRGDTSTVYLSGDNLGIDLFIKLVHSGMGNNPQIDKLKIGYDPAFDRTDNA